MVFDRSDFEAIVAPTSLKQWDGVSGDFSLDDRGVWPAAQMTNQLGTAERKYLEWRPASVFDKGTGLPQSRKFPALSFPFSENQLAAFMLFGMGRRLELFYGDLEEGPVANALDAIGPVIGSAEQALIGAYEALRGAQEKVGALDPTFDQRARDLCEKYTEQLSAARLRERVSEFVAQPGDNEERMSALQAEYRHRQALAKDAVKEIELEMEQAQAGAAKAEREWLKEMVQELLKPGVAPAAPPNEQQDAPGCNKQDVPNQSSRERQAHRWQLCIDAGLTMPKDTYANLPRGIRNVAESLRITRQALAQDLNAHRERVFGK